MTSSDNPPQENELSVIGWREWVALPELGVRAIKAKIDTGARSSALHAFDLETFERKGKTFVRFNIHPYQRQSRKVIQAEAEVIEFRHVRSSSGHSAERPVILTEVEILGQKCRIELTLARRDQMGFRMLLGRQALRDRFLIKPGRSYLSGTRKEVLLRSRRTGSKKSASAKQPKKPTGRKK